MHLGTHKHPSSPTRFHASQEQGPANSCSASSASYTIPPSCKYNEIFTTKRGDNDNLSKRVFSHLSAVRQLYPPYTAEGKSTLTVLNEKVEQKTKISFVHVEQDLQQDQEYLRLWLKRHFKGTVYALVRDLL